MSRRIPVVVASQMMGAGGTERQLVEFAKAMDQQRFEPHVLVFIRDAQRAAELESLGVKVVEIPVRSFGKPPVLAHAWAFVRYLRQHRIAVFHAFDMPLAVFGAPLARLARVPVVLTSVRGHRDLYTPAYQKLLRVSDRFVDGIVANAQALADHLVQRGVPRELLRLCHNGLDLSRYPYSERPTPSASRPLTIGSICLLRQEKNLPLLLRAFAALPGRETLRLRITGSGAELESLEKEAAALGLQSPEFAIQPVTRDVAGALRDIDLFVLPSFSEGLSNSIMEAMASGCCVAASAVGGNVELIEDGKTGLLFDPLRVETLVDVLQRLVADPKLRRSLAEAGSRSIHERFAMSVSARKMESIYLSFLNHTQPN